MTGSPQAPTSSGEQLEVGAFLRGDLKLLPPAQPSPVS